MAFYKTSFLLSAVVGAAAQDEMARMRAEIEALKSETARLRSAVAKPRRNLRFGAYEASSEEEIRSAIISIFNEQWTSFELGGDYEGWKQYTPDDNSYQFIVPAFGMNVNAEFAATMSANYAAFGLSENPNWTSKEFMWIAVRGDQKNKYWLDGTDMYQDKMLYSVTHDTFIVDPTLAAREILFQNATGHWYVSQTTEPLYQVKLMKKIIAKTDYSFRDCVGDIHEYTAGQMIQMANVTAYYNEALENVIFTQDNFYTLLTVTPYCDPAYPMPSATPTAAP